MLLARLYREVANGGFGPGYQLFPGAGQGRTTVEAFHTERAESQGEADPHGPTGDGTEADEPRPWERAAARLSASG